ncbi:MAG: thioredoxin family protein [Chlorobi bacterium]|nr:thioredoxin family protein [Chlorobiota bacterium]
MRTEIGSMPDIQEHIKNEMALIIYFYNDDCPPCLSLRPKVEAMVKNEYPEMELVFINSKHYPEIPASFGIFSNPTLLVYFDGKESKRFSKYVSTSELSQSIDRYYNLIFS